MFSRRSFFCHLNLLQRMKGLKYTHVTGVSSISSRTAIFFRSHPSHHQRQLFYTEIHGADYGLCVRECTEASMSFIYPCYHCCCYCCCYCYLHSGTGRQSNFLHLLSFAVAAVCLVPMKTTHWVRQDPLSLD